MRAIVRKQANIEDLREKSQLVATSYDKGQLEFVVLSDFTDTAAIGAAFDGITVIIHLASPLAKAVSGSLVSNKSRLAASLESPDVNMVKSCPGKRF